MKLNLYKISRSDSGDYDTYDSAVVAAESEDEARHTHPNGTNRADRNAFFHTWVSPDKVIVQFIGIAASKLEKGVIVSSFNAG